MPILYNCVSFGVIVVFKKGNMMKIRLYDSVQKLPGDSYSKLSDVFLTKEQLLKDEKDSELRDCLLAILETDLRLTAHIYINRKPVSLGGSEVRPVVTTSSVDQEGIIWGTGYDIGREGGPYVKSLHVDIDISKVAEHAKEKYKNSKKNFKEWKKFFYDIFENMRKEKLKNIEQAQHILTFLRPV